MQSDLIAEDGGDLVDAPSTGVEATRPLADAGWRDPSVGRGILMGQESRARPLADESSSNAWLLAVRPENRRMAELAGFLPASSPGAWEEAVAVFRRPAPPDPRQLPPMILSHEVGPSDTLWSLASHYGTDVATLMQLNGIRNPRRLHVGQRLRVLTVPGLIHAVRRGESLWTIARAYRISTQAIVEANRLGDPDEIVPGMELILPGAKPPPPAPTPRPRGSPARPGASSSLPPTQASGSRGVARAQTSASSPPAAGKGAAARPEPAARGDLPSWTWPLDGPISSEYGPRWGRVHEGVDIAVNLGTPVRAAAGGQVTFAGWYGAYGNLVIIDHGNGVTTRYAHSSRITVRVGRLVNRGEVVAYSGSTGRSTGPHLHFEIRLRGRPVDPLAYLP